MKASILIVSKNRKEDLAKTIRIIESYIDPAIHEIRILLDGCTDKSEELQDVFPKVHWEVLKTSIGPSRARNLLYKKSAGDILIGFDDDSHPIQKNFIKITDELFTQYPEVGLIGYKEVKGIFLDEMALIEHLIMDVDYFTRDFLGCGFAVKKSVYDKTRGFPEWVDIYGEELCLSMEILNHNYSILYSHKIVVNHRVDKKERSNLGGNYFRFGKQLKNSAFFYLVYYPFPLLISRISKLFFSNFFKYGIKERKYFIEFYKSLWEFIIKIRKVKKFRSPVKQQTLNKFNSLKNPHY